MPILARSLIRLTLWVSVLVVLLGVAERMTTAGLGCPLGLGCSNIEGSQIGGALHWLPLLSKGHQWGSVALSVLMMSAWGFAVAVFSDLGMTVFMLLTGAIMVLGLEVWLGLHLDGFKSIPWVMVSQLPLGFVMIGLLNVALVKARALQSPCPAQNEVGPWIWLVRLALLLLFINVVLGAWVSATGAGLACPDFPTCRGVIIPAADYVSLLLLILSPSADTHALFEAGAPEAMHMLHRLTGFAVCGIALVLGLGLSFDARVSRLSRMGLWLNALAFMVVLSSLLLVERHLSIVLALLHVLTAILMLLLLTGILLRLQQRESSGAIEVLHDIQGRESGSSIQVPLRDRLGRTRGGFAGFLSKGRILNASFLEELESQLLMADLGVSATREIMDQLERQLNRQELGDMDALRDRLKAQLSEMIRPVSLPLVIDPEIRPFVILVVGVNGVGKTTTIGKLAKRIQSRGLSVLLAAGDTFRAAAVEQLEVWGERNGVPVIAQHQGADSASVIFDAFEAARARKVDVLIADTAGRLHTKSNLMEELSKVKRILSRLDASAPHEVLLVLDAGTGQNAVNQARQFHEAVGLTGLVLTKLDGTAKGGVLFALARQFGIPIRFIGVGESVDDLRDFDADAFIAALFDQ